MCNRPTREKSCDFGDQSNRFLVLAYPQLTLVFAEDFVPGPRAPPYLHTLNSSPTLIKAKMAFCIASSTSTFVGAKVAVRAKAARRTAR